MKLEDLLSGNNSKRDIKAVLSWWAIATAILVYTAYAVKGFFVAWDMPKSVENITIALIIGGILGAGSTLFNQKLGVQGYPQAYRPPTPQDCPRTPEQEEMEGPDSPEPLG